MAVLRVRNPYVYGSNPTSGNFSEKTNYLVFFPKNHEIFDLNDKIRGTRFVWRVVSPIDLNLAFVFSG